MYTTCWLGEIFKDMTVVECRCKFHPNKEREIAFKETLNNTEVEQESLVSSTNFQRKTHFMMGVSNFK